MTRNRAGRIIEVTCSQCGVKYMKPAAKANSSYWNGKCRKCNRRKGQFNKGWGINEPGASPGGEILNLRN